MKFKIIVIIETIIIVFLFLLLPLSCSYISEHTTIKDPQWFREVSPDEQHTIVANFIGNNTSERICVQIMLFNENHETSTMMITVDNDGDVPDEKNYRLEWHDEYVKITTINNKRSEKSFRLYWEDLNFSSSTYDESNRFLFDW